MWHERFYPQNKRYVKDMLNKSNIKFVDSEKKCENCVLNKITRMPFVTNSNTASEVLGVVHADVAGPMEIASVGGARYFLLLKDDLSNYRVVYFLKHKSEVPEKKQTLYSYLREIHLQEIENFEI